LYLLAYVFGEFTNYNRLNIARNALEYYLKVSINGLSNITGNLQLSNRKYRTDTILQKRYRILTILKAMQFQYFAVSFFIHKFRAD